MTGCGQAGSCCPLPTELRRTSYPVRYFDHKLSSVPPRNCRPISLRLSTKSLRQAFKSNSNFRRSKALNWYSKALGQQNPVLTVVCPILLHHSP